MLLFGGVVAPAVFLAAAALTGLAEPGYSVVDDHLSGLAAVPASTRWLTTLAFVVLAAGIVAVGRSLGRERRAIATLAALAGLAVVLVGLLPRDCVDVACTAPSWHHRAHDAASVPAYLALVGLPPLVARPLGASRRVLVAVVAATVAAGLLFALDPFDRGSGMFQRVAVAVPLVWLAATTTCYARQSLPDATGVGSDALPAAIRSNVPAR